MSKFPLQFTDFDKAQRKFFELEAADELIPVTGFNIALVQQLDKQSSFYITDNYTVKKNELPLWVVKDGNRTVFNPPRL